MNAIAKTDPQPLPHDLEAEQAVLGAIMLDNQKFWPVSDILKPEHFFEALHRRLYEAMGEMVAAGKPADVFTLRTRFAEDAALADVGGQRYLASLYAAAVPVVMPTAYAEVVRSGAFKRRMLSAADALQALSKSGDIDDEAVIAKARAELDALEFQSTSGIRSRSLFAAGEAALNAAIEATKQERIPGVTFGSQKLDSETGGMQPGELVILAGRPGMGKSAMAQHIAIAAARQRTRDNLEQCALFFSIEMSDEQLAARALASEADADGAGFPYSEMRKGKATMMDLEAAARALRKLKDVAVEVIEGNFSAQHIHSISRRFANIFAAQGKRLALVVVDHLQIVKADKDYRGNRVSELTSITGTMKQLGKDLRAPVILLSQLSRNVENRPDKRPHMADLRESGSIEQDADIVLFMLRQEYYKGKEQPDEDNAVEHQDWLAEMAKLKGRLEVFLEKNRNGGAERKIDLWCDLSRNVILDWPPKRARQ